MSKKKRTYELPVTQSLNWLNNMLMVTAAHRYCLGRETYIVGACCEWLTAVWSILEPNTQNVILRDTIAAIMDGEAGSKAIDEPAWRRFCERAWDEITIAQRDWVERALSHKGKPWPLFPGKTHSR
jgi:hypothetical protein